MYRKGFRSTLEKVGPQNTIFILAQFLLISCMSCLEYQEARVTDFEGANIPPFIDKTHVRPAPSEVLKAIKLGANCKMEFTIPPIKDPNRNDILYYIWSFKKQNDLHGKLLQPGAGIIRAENRDNAVISLSVDKQAIETALGEKLNSTFFEGNYLIEFYVADRKYIIPDNRYLESGAYEDYMHWNISFSNLDC